MSETIGSRTSWCEERGVWHARDLSGRMGFVGPIAQRWLDNDAPLVTGLPPTTRQVPPVVADFTALNEGLQNLAAWADQVVEQLVRAFQPLPTSEGGVG